MTMIWLLWLPVTLAAPKIFPLVDPGLFVISGVRTCGGGGGYCLLGLDCTLDEDFLPDNEAGQHCDGLKSAFTPSAHFVCCRATNKTAYKPPIVFPSVLTTTNMEPMTARTTTLNVLENEIDEVLQKVAQSVNAAKKSPVTEASLLQADETDQTSELRESEEVDEDEEEEEGEEMVADSPIEELWQEMSGEDEDSDESPGILEENKNIKESAHSDNPVTISTPIMGVPYDQAPKIEESSIEKQSEENTISPGVILKDSVTEENSDMDDENSNENEENIPQDSDPIKDNKHQYNFSEPTVQEELPSQVDLDHNNNSESHKLSQESKNHMNGVTLSKEELPQISKYEITNSPSLGKISSDSETILENSKFGDKPLIVKAKDEDNESSPDTTPKPEVLEEIINENESTNIPNDETQSNFNEATNLPPNKNDTDNKGNMIPIVDIIPNETVPVSNDDIQMVTDNMAKENNTAVPVSNGLDVNVIKLQTKNTTEPDENQLVTTTSMSPTTHTSGAIQPMVMQGHPGATEPCTKAIKENCTQEVKFILRNQTLCFGSVYALDWVVTSASCALRVFRAGMLNVVISPLTEMSKGHVKTIVVHESYAENSGASGQGMEANNIGLVQLHTPMMEWSPCVPCLPEAGKEFSGVNCSAVTSQPLAPTSPQLCSQPEDCNSARSASSVSTCEGPSRVLRDDLGFSYVTLNCDILWEPRFYDPSSRGSGAPLFCDGGVLAGVETGTGVGLMVYTPLTPYLPWLLKNTRPGSPEQTFNVG